MNKWCISKNSQFSTDIKLDGKTIETVSETKLLGTLITNNLSRNKKTEKIVKEIKLQSSQRIGMILREFISYRSEVNWSSLLFCGTVALQKSVVIDLKEFRSQHSKSYLDLNMLTMLMHFRYWGCSPWRKGGNICVLNLQRSANKWRN